MGYNTDVPTRRLNDRANPRPVYRLNEPAAQGRALLLTTGLLTAAAAPALGLNRNGVVDLALVSVSMVLVVAASFFITWERLPAPTLLVFPFLVFVAFTVLSLGQHASFAPVSGYFTLCYAYAGLTQRPRFSVLLVAPSSVALVAVYGGLTAQVAVRLVVASIVWVILAEILAAFVARQKQMTNALERAASSDVLTGLPNRRDLNKQLLATTPETTLVICDLDHFKRLNDTYGHSAGDRVLADFGSTVRAVLREGDYCARFGGEEFVLLLPTTRPDGVASALERLRLRWAHLQPDVTFSAGVAQCRADRDPMTTLKAADDALYVAKETGRNRTCHEPLMTADNVADRR